MEMLPDIVSALDNKLAATHLANFYAERNRFGGAREYPTPAAARAYKTSAQLADICDGKAAET